jgi:hypothetical protein
MRMIRRGTMHPTSRIALPSSVSFTLPTLLGQGHQRGCMYGYDVGRRIEMRAITLMTTSLRDHIQDVAD